MDLAAMTYTHLFLGIILVPLMRLDGAQGPCPTPCRCTLEILNCSRITNPPGFHRVPLPKLAVHPHPFMYLDFTGNEISSIGKETWKAYPWTEHLVLKDNSLSRLQNTSLEGLLSLTYLDLSCNKIQIIEKNGFDAVPFLQIINLSGNDVQQIAYGTFQAWHGMQFLLKVDLSHNPLAVIQDSHFFGLPSLKFLDLGATEITPRILENLLQTSLKLRMLILPQKMSCCLCRIKEDIEVWGETVKLECTESCGINATLCDKEPLNSIQEIMKVLEIRKMNGSGMLNILPDTAIPNKDTPQHVELNSKMLSMAENYSSLAAHFNLLESGKRLMQMKAGEPLDVNWADKGELEKLSLLVSLLQKALKERIVELEKGSLEVAVQNELSAQVSKKSTDEAPKWSTDAFLRKERHMKKVTRENWLGTKKSQEDTLVSLGGGGREVAETTRQPAEEPIAFVLLNKAGSWRKLAEGLDPQRAPPFLRSRQAAFQSSWNRSISNSLTNALKPTGSIVADNNENDLTSLSSDRNPLVVLGNGFGAHTLTKEELLDQLLHRSNPPAEDGKSEISAIESDPSLNELSPDIKLTHGTYWEHQRTSVSPSLNLASQNDYLLQGDLFEAELNKLLTFLIPNIPVRKLISHLFRILKMDCTAPTVQMACTKLISRTGLLMKLFSENVNETSSVWNSFFWPSRNVANMTTANSRKLEKPLDRKTSQGTHKYEYGNKLLWAVSVTAIILIIIAVICLIKICSQRSAAKDRIFLGKRKKSLPDLEDSRIASLVMDKPLWLKDTYQDQDETQKNSIVDKLHDENSLEEVDIVNAKPTLPKLPLKKISLKTLSIPIYELPLAPPAAPPPPPPPRPPSSTSQKPKEKKGSDTAGRTSEVTSSKVASSAAEEGDDEDKEDSADKSEGPTTEATSETAESEEGKEEESE